MMRYRLKLRLGLWTRICLFFDWETWAELRQYVRKVEDRVNEALPPSETERMMTELACYGRTEVRINPPSSG